MERVRHENESIKQTRGEGFQAKQQALTLPEKIELAEVIIWLSDPARGWDI